jgi:hypothetical protein
MNTLHGGLWQAGSDPLLCADRTLMPSDGAGASMQRCGTSRPGATGLSARPNPFWAADPYASGLQCSRHMQMQPILCSTAHGLRTPNAAIQWLLPGALKPNENYHSVIFLYYLEDNSLQISEPRQDNSGLPQVCSSYHSPIHIPIHIHFAVAESL